MSECGELCSWSAVGGCWENCSDGGKGGGFWERRGEVDVVVERGELTGGWNLCAIGFGGYVGGGSSREDCRFSRNHLSSYPIISTLQSQSSFDHL